jgi:DNA-binding phage protein
MWLFPDLLRQIGSPSDFHAPNIRLVELEIVARRRPTTKIASATSRGEGSDMLHNMLKGDSNPRVAPISKVDVKVNKLSMRKVCHRDCLPGAQQHSHNLSLDEWFQTNGQGGQ